MTRSGGPHRVRRLHEVRTYRHGRKEGDQAEQREPFEVAGLYALDDHLGEGRHESVDDTGRDDVEERLRALAQPDPQNAEDHDHDQQQHEDRDQLLVGDFLLGRDERRDRHEDEDAADAGDDRTDRFLRRLVPADPRIQQRGDHQRESAQWLYDDERRQREGTELAQDRHREHERPGDPRGTLQKTHKLLAGQPGAAG